MISLPIARAYDFIFNTYSFVVSSTQKTRLLLGLGRTILQLGSETLLDVGLGVDELLDLLDLQDPIGVGGDGCDEDHLTGHGDSGCGRHLGGEL